MNNIVVLILSFQVFFLWASDGTAFKLDPYSVRNNETGLYERSIVGGRLLHALPIHENLTLKAIAAAKLSPQYKIMAFQSNLIKGVRWNDDPLGLARKRPMQFYFSYNDSCSHSEPIDPDWDLLYRTHCGDMQFLHAMASSAMEPAIDTQKKIMMWLEFMFKVAAGRIDKDWHFQSLHQFLDAGSADIFRNLMTNNGRTRMMWQTEKLLTLECDRWFTWKGLFFRARLTELTCKDLNNAFDARTIQDIALGSLLHVLQDSFSHSHVLRERGGRAGKSKISGVGRVLQFGQYLLQDEARHGEADLNINMEERSSEEFDLAAISARVIELVIAQREDEQCRWNEARTVLSESLYVVFPHRTPGGLGYEKSSDGVPKSDSGLKLD